MRMPLLMPLAAIGLFSGGLIVGLILRGERITKVEVPLDSTGESGKAIPSLSDAPPRKPQHSHEELNRLSGPLSQTPERSIEKTSELARQLASELELKEEEVAQLESQIHRLCTELDFWKLAADSSNGYMKLCETLEARDSPEMRGLFKMIRAHLDMAWTQFSTETLRELRELSSKYIACDDATQDWLRAVQKSEYGADRMSDPEVVIARGKLDSLFKELNQELRKALGDLWREPKGHEGG